MISKNIYTVWLSDSSETPPLIQQCIDSQRIPGYNHHLITLDNCKKDKQYVRDAIAAKRWVKATDFLRMQYLYEEGGIFLDADVEILAGKNFDSFLNNRMFAAKENNGFIGVAVMGSEKGHPFVKQWMEWVETHFKGDDDFNFESSMEPVVHGYYEWGWDRSGFALLRTNLLYPFDHQWDTVNIEPQTVTYHHFYKSWKAPEVAILIPTLNRPEGLQRCLDSIKTLNYPQEKITISMDATNDTVPVKVNRMFAESTAPYVIYAADDIEFTPDALRNSLLFAEAGWGLVAFNTQGLEGILPDQGNICEHFIIRRDFVPLLERGEIFSTDFHHVGCDNWLYAQARKLNSFAYCPTAVVHHYHFSKGAPMDDTYTQGWSKTDEDRAILKEKLGKLWQTPHDSITPSVLSS